MVIMIDSRLLCLVFEYHPYWTYRTDGVPLFTGPKHSPLSIVTHNWLRRQTSLGRVNEGIDLLFLDIASCPLICNCANFSTSSASLLLCFSAACILSNKRSAPVLSMSLVVPECMPVCIAELCCVSFFV